MTGTLDDTYVAAIQHDLVSIQPDTYRLGVVRKPTPWFYGVVDENEPALGPPSSLLDEVKTHQQELENEGLGEAEAHNTAMDGLDYDRRYLDHLEHASEARTAIDDLLSALDSGTDIVLVCFENTDEKRCHRTLLREYIETKRAD